jgi:cephalosporin-C deacetylase
VDAVKLHESLDSSRIALTGGSQGGGITIAVSGLMPEDIAVAMPDVPFLCHFERSIQKTPNPPFTEITKYLSIHRDKVETVLNTLSYFDGVNFAKRCQARAYYSVGLMDETCLPSTVFAAYNHVTSTKAIEIYTYNNHEGGSVDHLLQKIRFLNELWD